MSTIALIALRWLTSSLLVSLALSTGCSSDETEQGQEVEASDEIDEQEEDQSDEQEGSDDEENSQGNDEFGQNSGEQFNLGQDNIDNSFADFDNGGAGVNNATVNEFDQISNEGAIFNAAAAENGTFENLGDSEAYGGIQVTSNSPSFDGQNMPSSRPAILPPGSPPPGQASVMYVTSSGSQVMDQPGGQPTTILEKGDLSLVYPESEYARTVDGYYLPLNDLTRSPVGRNLPPAQWR